MIRALALRLPALSLALLLPNACASAPPPAPAPVASQDNPAPNEPKSLYERLGGLPAIEAVIDSLLKNIAGDVRIAHRFALSDLAAVRGHLVDQVCAATGGPCTYKGKDMKSAHKNQHLTDADFNALVEDLVKALEEHKVPDREKGELLSALAGMRGDIVGQ